MGYMTQEVQAMPTGYTAIVEEGGTFEKFVWRCARAMSPLFSMREKPFEEPIPDKIEPLSTYHLNGISRAKARLEELRAMTPAQIEAAALEAFRVDAAYWEETAIEARETLAKYEKMRERVEAWEPAEAYAGLKEFMLQQIAASVAYTGEPEKPKLVDGPDWHAQQLEICERDLNYHEGKWDEDLKAAEFATNWVQGLRAEVPQPR